MLMRTLAQGGPRINPKTCLSGRAPEEAGERAIDGEGLNIGLGSVVLEWRHRFGRQVAFAESPCRLMWQVGVKGNQLEHY
ncbi:LOW QUALITY PROTEIN: hypothetical protein PHMEG_00015354 [Phytophthora megakarya]|uniref:Uncharacterized protein n=1 Tax=Phytophthora megakarya TaxID=4795 RepID=A0A225W1H7_9STRA|nr:LOW QUALITY PROTEIN: hypothetical protein PHMEG_00015354 [Phytophthora megakarya]